MFHEDAAAYAAATLKSIQEELYKILENYPDAKFLNISSGIDRDEYRGYVDLNAVQAEDGTFLYIGENGYERDGNLLGVQVEDLPEDETWEYDKQIFTGLPENYYLYQFEKLPGVTEVKTNAAAYLEFDVDIQSLANA